MLPSLNVVSSFDLFLNFLCLLFVCVLSCFFSYPRVNLVINTLSICFVVSLYIHEDTVIVQCTCGQVDYNSLHVHLDSRDYLNQLWEGTGLGVLHSIGAY